MGTVMLTEAPVRRRGAAGSCHRLLARGAVRHSGDDEGVRGSGLPNLRRARPNVVRVLSTAEIDARV